LVEGAARNDDPQILVEHKEGFADRVHDGLGQQERLFATLKSLQGRAECHAPVVHQLSLRLIQLRRKRLECI